MKQCIRCDTANAQDAQNCSNCGNAFLQTQASAQFGMRKSSIILPIVLGIVGLAVLALIVYMLMSRM